MSQDICKNAFRKSGIFPWNSQNIDFSRLTELRPNQDVARPTHSVILPECEENPINSNQGQINSSIIGQPLDKTRIQIIKEHLEKYLDPVTLQEFVFNDGPIWTGRSDMRGLYTYWRSIEEEYQSEVRATSLNLRTSTPLSSRTLTNFNLPNFPKGPLAPQAEPVIDIDETSASSNETFNRGSSPAQTNEVFQESPPISPNKNLIGNPLGSCEAPYICEKPLTGNTLPSCSSDIFLRVTVNRLKERVHLPRD